MGILDALFNPTKNSDRAYNDARTEMGQTRQQTDPFYGDAMSQGQDANKMRADLLGLNGAQAQQAAQQFFSNNPAAQISLQRGLEALDASAAAKGMHMSGDTLKALHGFGQEQHELQRDKYLNQLHTVGQQGFQGAGGLTQNAGSIAQLGINQGATQDAGNQAAFGNLLGLGSTLFGMGTGTPTGGVKKPFAGGATGTGRIPTPTQNPRIV